MAILPRGSARVLADSIIPPTKPTDTIKRLQEQDVIDVWDQCSHSSGSSSSRKSVQFRRKVIQYYELGKAKCMLTGISGEGRELTAAHIWPAKHNMNPLLTKYHLTSNDVESARNGLLLLTPIEDMFDTKQICFYYDPLQQLLKCQVLDPDLHNTKYHGDKLFSELQGKSLCLPKNKFPFRQLLNEHARASFTSAKQKKWISDDIFKDYVDYAHLSDIAAANNRDL